MAKDFAASADLKEAMMEAGVLRTPQHSTSLNQSIEHGPDNNVRWVINGHPDQRCLLCPRKQNVSVEIAGR